MGTTICRAPRCRDSERTGQTRARSAVSGSHLCSVCRENLLEDLAALPELHVASEHVLDTRRPAMRERVTGGSYTGIALNTAAVDARSATTGVLASWSGLVAEERNVSSPRNREVGTLTRFLTRHLDWLASHPALPDFAEEISNVTRAARAVAYPNPQRHIELGTCIVPGCEYTVHATMRTDDGNRPSQVSCEYGHAIPPQQWLLLARQVDQAKSTEPGAPTAGAEDAA